MNHSKVELSQKLLKFFGNFLIEFQRTISMVQVFLQRIEEKCSNNL